MTKQITLAKTGFDGAAVALISAGVGLVTTNMDDNNRIAIGAVLVVIGLVVFVVRHAMNEGWRKSEASKTEDVEKPKKKKKSTKKE